MYLTPKQLEVLEEIRDYIRENGYAPTLQELSNTLSVSTVTVFEHVKALERKGALRREKHKTRAIELAEPGNSSRRLQLMGHIAAGHPIESTAQPESIDISELLGVKDDRDLYLLAIRGDSMADEHIRDGDYVIVERRNTARNGETVVALVDGREVTLKKIYHEEDRVRLQPANPAMRPIYARDVRVQGIVVGVLRRY
ncbi:MAG: transcriptional repressor LexA [Planctomycetota bacterium]